MYYVYILNSTTNIHRFYVGFTSDLIERLKEHNAGDSSYTLQYRPWFVVSYIVFLSKESALDFEKFLKSSAGRRFQKKHLGI